MTEQFDTCLKKGRGLGKASLPDDAQTSLDLGSGDRSRASRQLEIFARRALDLADQVAAGELRFLDAIDMAYDAAIWAGLVKAVGDDIVQATLAAAFANARGPA